MSLVWDGFAVIGIAAVLIIVAFVGVEIEWRRSVRRFTDEVRRDRGEAMNAARRLRCYRRCELDAEYRARMFASGKVDTRWRWEVTNYAGTALDGIGEILGMQRRIVEVVDAG